MYGIIHSQLKKYVTDKYDAPTWDLVLTNAGLPGRVYMAGIAYPDSEVLSIVMTASTMTGRPVPELLEDFGAFIVPALAGTYKAFIRPEWRTLDFIENTEHAIHKAVRMKDKGAEPPRLAVARASANEVVIDYRSARKMCSVAKGIARGVSEHYNEHVDITESECMHKGGARCLISVKLAS